MPPVAHSVIDAVAFGLGTHGKRLAQGILQSQAELVVGVVFARIGIGHQNSTSAAE